VTDLLDGNVLVALGTPSHVHHEVAVLWLTGRTEPYATTPITEGTLLRGLIRGGGTAADAFVVLDTIRGNTRHRFWPDDLPYDRAMLRLVRGHAGVTDAYLVALARAHGGRVVTFDRALAATYPDAVQALPVR
jgi:toxin-antitoxin system PIN domain toxin